MSEYGLQTYSVSSAIGKDFYGTVQKIAQIGYKSVELCWGNAPAQEVNRAVRDAGIKVSGVHIGVDEAENDFAGTVKFFHDIGCPNYIVAGIPWEGDEFYRSIDRIIKCHALLKEEGIDLMFHNHSMEFSYRNKYGVRPIEALLNHTAINLEIDTFWAYVGGANPSEFLVNNRDRIRFVHIKDGLRNGEGRTIGQGEAPVIESRNSAEKLGIYMVVESENEFPDGITEVTESFRYLTTH